MEVTDNFSKNSLISCNFLLQFSPQVYYEYMFWKQKFCPLEYVFYHICVNTPELVPH